MVANQQTQKILKYLKRHHPPTPFMVIDLGLVAQKCHDFRQALPGVRLFYALKALDDEALVRSIDRFVDGYDVASLSEIEKLLDMGISADRLSFSNPVKSPDAIKRAGRLGVRMMAFQSKSELDKIKKHARRSRLFLRLKVADETSEISFSSKFGCEPDEVPELLTYAQKLGLTVEGLTFHVGSQATFSGVWEKALERCGYIIEQAKLTGLDITSINLGGGFPVRYKPHDPSINDTGRVVAKALRKQKVQLEGINFLAEPGRFLVADAGTVVTTILGIEERAGTNWLFLDVGSFQAFLEIFEFGYFPYPVYSLAHLNGKRRSKATRSYVLTGPTCDSYDTLTLKVDLPADLREGDQLLIGQAGAYSVVYGSNFNGFDIPPRQFIR